MAELMGAALAPGLTDTAFTVGLVSALVRAAIASDRSARSIITNAVTKTNTKASTAARCRAAL